MSPLAKWAAVSALTLATVEIALTKTGHGTYTGMYRRARTGPAGVLPLIAAGVVLAHLEGWIPPRWDPFSW